MQVGRNNFMMTSLRVPVEIVKGETMQAIGGANQSGGGSYSIDSLVSSPATRETCNSSASLEWHKEKVAFGLLGTWDVKSMQVKDLDATKDMTVGVEKNAEGLAQVVVRNGSDADSTELRFNLGAVDTVPSELGRLPAQDVRVAYREKGRRQEGGLVVDGQTFLLAGGAFKRV